MDDFRPRVEKALSGSYTLDRELGGGGMSRTYLAREHALSRRVVVKVLSPELLQGISVERFKREVLLAAQLQHPHVVPVLSAGDADGLPWFTMPYVDGDSLRKRLGEGPIGISEGVAILRDVAKALTYAHANGVVHRDIKPDNVLLSGGSATVTDFGIAKAISASRTDPGGATLTQAGTAIGTPAYMAPEQAAGDPNLDHRADIYSFGAMAYEVLSGQQVFPGLAPVRLMVAHLSETPRHLRELRADVPPVLSDLVMQCLAKAPEERPPDAASIARILDTATSSGPSTAAASVLMGPRQTLQAALMKWALVSAAVVLIAWAATEVIGLPNWALAGAVGVMLAGLPSIVGTWWVQRTASKAATSTPTLTPGGTAAPVGTLATFALKASPHVSWKRTWRMGAIAVAAFALLVSSFMVSRAMGIGPAASLMSKGEFGERESVVVADFRPPAGDTLLGLTVAEALRTDLGQSKNLRVLTRASVREVLQRMQRPAESSVLFEVAREIATREGAKAVIDGEITRLGGGYVLAARLVTAQGDELGTYRETAKGDDDLIEAVGKLSRKIREEVGESLKGIRTSYTLDRVTTSSLPALRKYMEGVKAEETGGELERAKTLYEEAIALDTAFAMAWRKLAVVRQSSAMSREKQIEAFSAAWRFRDRLSDEERLLTEGTYWVNGPEGDAQKALAAYEQLLARDSTNRVALNNAAVILTGQGYHSRAYELYGKAIRQPDTPVSAFGNLQQAGLNIGVPAKTIDSIETVVRQRFPTNANLWELRAFTLWARQDIDSFVAIAAEARRTARSRRQEDRSLLTLTRVSANTGRAAAALSYATEREIAFARARDGSTANAGVPPGAWMQTAIDSATFSVMFAGDEARARSYLQRAFARPAVDAVPSVDRNWVDGATFAALAGDSTLARAAQQGYERDRLRMDPFRASTVPSMSAKVAFAAGRWDDAVADLETADKDRGDPLPEEMFLRALAHDRAGRADSAIAWFGAMAQRTTAITNMPQYMPHARKRLAELYDTKGDAAKAIQHYEWFADRWKNADASLQSTVRAIRARAAALKAKAAPG